MGPAEFWCEQGREIFSDHWPFRRMNPQGAFLGFGTITFQTWCKAVADPGFPSRKDVNPKGGEEGACSDNSLPPANEVCEGYVFTPVCQSSCSRGGGKYLGSYAPAGTPSQAGTPPWQVQPPGQVYPLPGRYTPSLAGTPSPWHVHPPGQVPPGRYPPAGTPPLPGRYTPQQVHPPG